MIIQTAAAGGPRMAIMMYEHTALSGQFARAFGNDRFEPVSPDDLMFAELDQKLVADPEDALELVAVAALHENWRLDGADPLPRDVLGDPGADLLGLSHQQMLDEPLIFKTGRPRALP